MTLKDLFEITKFEIIVIYRDNESRIYNVRANAGDFIIGEAGRIDINSGQTVEVSVYMEARRLRLVCRVSGTRRWRVRSTTRRLKRSLTDTSVVGELFVSMMIRL